MSFELIHKARFTNQLLTLPREQIPHILEKVELLRDDPAPRGDLKKKLQSYGKHVYRLRVGDYRVIYSFGDGWVCLLGVDSRADIYRGDVLVEEPDVPPRVLPDEEAPTPQEPRPGVRAATPRVDETEFLPARIDEDLLHRLRVPAEFVPALTACRTFDDLACAGVPNVVRDRVFDCIYSADYERVMQEPDYRTGEASDLLRYVDGDLLGFLLKLDPEQERYVAWAADGAGPVLLKGGPGTGKSTIALYRARSLLRMLRDQGIEPPRILFTTYTNALVTFSRQLLQRLLGADAPHVAVRTADSLARSIVTDADEPPEIVDAATLGEALQEALGRVLGPASARTSGRMGLAHLSPEYLRDEIATVIEARELATLEEYLEAPRAGRRVALDRAQREVVWRVHVALAEILRTRGVCTWQQMRRRAVELAREHPVAERYDGVIVDEAQDLDPTVLRLLMALCDSPSRIFITADANQSIYGSAFRWADVHRDLRFQGRAGVLHTNHRSTREIGEAARAYLAAAALESPEGRPVYRLSGPRPARRFVRDGQEEARLMARFMRDAAYEFHVGIASGAVLVPSEAAGHAVAARLVELGIPAACMLSRGLDLEQAVVKVMPLRSAKGLEFPMVAIGGFCDGFFSDAPSSSGAGEMEEWLLRARRTMFVAMTRAMRALLVAVPDGSTSPLLQGFAEELWNTGQARPS